MPLRHPHRLRLCELPQWAPDSSFGFTMHTEKGKSGQFIGKVDNNSPAELGGLREGDRIIEVDHVNVETSKHDEVAAKIKSSTGPRVTFLVIDAEADDFFKNQNIKLSGDMPFVDVLSCPENPSPLTARSGNILIN